MENIEGIIGKADEIIDSAAGIVDATHRFTALPGVVPLALVLLAILIFARPLKFIVKLVINSVAGLAALVLLHYYVGELLGVTMELDTANLLAAGIAGVPGVALMFALRWLDLI